MSEQGDGSASTKTIKTMGLFDKLKQAANFVTGGAATVNVRPVNQVNDGNGPIELEIQARAKDVKCNVRNVYLKVRAVEEVVAKDIDLARDEGGQVRSVREDVRNVYTTYETEIQVAGAQELEANQSYDWKVSIDIPQNMNGTYRGYNARHEWQVYAGLDMAGNDPDSGWVDLEIKK